MNKTVSKFTLAAGFVLAITFTLSCSGNDGGTDEPSSSSAENPSSSGIAPSSSGTPGSSDIVPSSSSSTAFSSPSLPSSSSSSIPTFACNMTATKGTVGVAITPAPAVTCNGSTVTTGLAWTPANLTPAAAGSVPISVSTSSGVCSSMEAQCGSVTVSPPTLACLMTAKIGGVGLAIAPAPAVYCNGNTVTTGLAWTPANFTPTAAGSVSVSVNAGSGICSGIAAQCGSVTVFTYGSLSYEGQSYKTIKIGTQTWMAENLNYNASGSRCYGDNTGGDSQNRCGTYGRLYNWATAMDLPESCNSGSCSSQIKNPHQGICPADWHLPSDAEWDVLSSYVQSNSGCRSCDARLLKAKSGNGTDDYGFSALPGGYGGSSGGFDFVGNFGFWWSATKYDASLAYERDMGLSNSKVGRDYMNMSFLFSVRCVQD